MGGPAPVTYLDIEAWARLTDRRLEPHEVQALTEIDRAVRYPGPEPEDEGE